MTTLLPDVIREASISARLHPLRSLLAALAIAAAVATIAIVVTALDGVARYARIAGARSFGSDTFVLTRVVPGQLSRRELADRLQRNKPIRRADVRFLDRYADGEVVYAPTAQRPADVSAGGRTFEAAAVNGSAATLPFIRQLDLARGRFFDEDEDVRGAQVAVIGQDIADELFPGRDPLDRVVRVALRGFRVIGVLERQGTAGGVTLDRYVYLPLRSFERLFGAPESLQVFAKAAEPERTQAAEDRARITMRARRQIRPGGADTFDLLTPDAARSFVLALAGRVGTAAGPISAMALLAAIVVVTNTILVSVTQRTREIGVRRAVGAPAGRVRLEVLVESVLTALVGGASGLLVAWAAVSIAGAALDMDLGLAGSTIVWSVFAAGLSGVLAGWYPAVRASRIDVIAALRLE